jgi:sigma-B regulation protein RsbU (phosphoserine phosphatase)
MRNLLELSLPARAESLKPLRDAFDSALARAGVPDAMRARLKLVVDEAAANVIRHAYGNCGEGEMRLAVGTTRGWLRIVLRDRAPPVDPSKIRPRDLSDCRPGGLGVNFIDESVERWRIAPLRRGCGNRLTLFKRLRTPAGGGVPGDTPA